MRRRFVVCLSIAVPAIALAPPSAHGDGLPVPMDGTGTSSIVAPDGDGPRYATVPAGDRTQLLRIDQDGGEITGKWAIDGEYTIPLVALDGTPSGLSADGETLALINPRVAGRRGFEFPRDETTFLIVDVRSNGRLRPHDPLTLEGDFSFDALSPDGETMYLVEYLSRDYNDYAVREYDLRRERLLPDPVLVAHEVSPGEMRGLPLTRATSADGRWEYTLYNGGGRRSDTAFIHTLDTERGLSHCVDLPMVSGQAAWRVDLGLTPDGGALNVTRGSTLLATLNTETFALSEPAVPAADSPTDDGGGLGGTAIAAIAAGAVALIGGALGLRRRRRAAATADLPPDPFVRAEPAAAPPDRDAERDRVMG